MNAARVYFKRLIAHFCAPRTPIEDLSDGMVLLVSGLAVIGVYVIALVWGLPA